MHLQILFKKFKQVIHTSKNGKLSIISMYSSYILFHVLVFISHICLILINSLIYFIILYKYLKIKLYLNLNNCHIFCNILNFCIFVLQSFEVCSISTEVKEILEKFRFRRDKTNTAIICE